MKISQAFSQGLRDVNRSKRYIFLVYGCNFLLAVVLAFTIGTTLHNSFGSHLAGNNMLAGFDSLWYQSFRAQAEGLAQTFSPTVVGIGAIFEGLDGLSNGHFILQSPTVVGVGILYFLMWTFFSAGFISTYAAADDEPSFFQKAAGAFPKFLFLAVVAGVLYFLLFYFVFGWLSKAVDELTRETIDERVHFGFTVAKYAILWLLICMINIIFDYSKIFTLIRTGTSVLTAPLKTLVLVLKNFGKTFFLYVTIGAVWFAILLFYWVIVPGAGQSSWFTFLAVFLLGQLYILSRIWTRALFYAGQTAMFSAIQGPDMN